MAIKRVGNRRMHDDPSNFWNPAQPGDVMHDAPGIYGQELREAPAIVITEAQMAPPKRVGAGRKRAGKRVTTASLETSERLEVKVPRKKTEPKTPINLRIPNSLLKKYKKGGPGYQTRMISVLDLFFKQGGKFTEA